MDKLRVLHIVNSFGIGGMENGVVHIINNSDVNRVVHGLCALRGAGRNVERISERGIDLYVLGENTKKTDRTIFCKISQVIKKFNPDIIHVRSWGPLWDTIAARLITLKRIKLVFSYHGKSFNEYPRCSIITRFKRELFLSFVDHIVTLNHNMVETLRNEFGVSDRITIIPNGVDIDRFSPTTQKRLLRAELNLPEDRILFGTVGRLSRIKDIDTILKASSLLKEKGLDFGLVIIGDGDQKEYIEKAIDSSNLNDIVRLMGATLSVEKYLQCLDIYVQASLYEGFSNTILEAMSTGLPAIVTSSGGNPNLVQHNYNGFLFEPKDFRSLAHFMVELYENEEKKRDFSASSRDLVLKNWTLMGMVEGYSSFYANVAS